MVRRAEARETLTITAVWDRRRGFPAGSSDTSLLDVRVCDVWVVGVDPGWGNKHTLKKKCFKGFNTVGLGTKKQGQTTTVYVCLQMYVCLQISEPVSIFDQAELSTYQSCARGFLREHRRHFQESPRPVISQSQITLSTEATAWEE